MRFRPAERSGQDFEKEPFGELERLVTQKLLDVAQGVAREELQMKSGCAWWPNSASAAMNRCASPFSSFWTLMFSASR